MCTPAPPLAVVFVALQKCVHVNLNILLGFSEIMGYSIMRSGWPFC